VLANLLAEFELTMALSGCASVGDIRTGGAIQSCDLQGSRTS
jgi:isopentenyl diphosphate isomerase/L-lactate dehydrogenase-like FMN-dependent dehydrogenase